MMGAEWIVTVAEWMFIVCIFAIVLASALFIVCVAFAIGRGIRWLSDELAGRHPKRWTGGPR